MSHLVCIDFRLLTRPLAVYQDKMKQDRLGSAYFSTAEGEDLAKRLIWQASELLARYVVVGCLRAPSESRQLPDTAQYFRLHQMS